jgi:NADH:ubiquinone oxidoreductase subunit 3 (subunit A)
MSARAESQEAVMADLAKAESAMAWMFIGLALFVVDLLVIFFLPAAIKLGTQRIFAAIILVLAVMSVGLMATGYSRRKNSSEE